MKDCPRAIARLFIDEQPMPNMVCNLEVVSKHDAVYQTMQSTGYKRLAEKTKASGFRKTAPPMPVGLLSPNPCKLCNIHGKDSM